MQKKRHTLLTFGFTGTGYYGLQSQSAEGDPERPTVSDVLRAALLKEGFIAPTNYAPLVRTKWSLASRTDKGVHAACAAVSCMLEYYDADVIEQVALAEAGDPAALDYETKVRTALSDGTKTDPSAPPNPEWKMSPSALARLNAALPWGVRFFSGTRVRKRFDAREQASVRVYEYLLPLHAVGASAEDLDRVLRTFEGTHRFHNFASGLRSKHGDAGIFRVAGGEGGGEGGEGGSVEWPLAISQTQSSSVFRSVLTCRVAREVELEGEPYLVLRIAGLAFVLHQIRHMVGAALAVTNGVVPADVMQIALKSPLRVDVAPLVPGCGLMLDEINWFSLKDNLYEARVPPPARAAMEAFKLDTVYPHVHALYQDGT